VTFKGVSNDSCVLFDDIPVAGSETLKQAS